MHQWRSPSTGRFCSLVSFHHNANSAWWKFACLYPAEQLSVMKFGELFLFLVLVGTLTWGSPLVLTFSHSFVFNRLCITLHLPFFLVWGLWHAAEDILLVSFLLSRRLCCTKWQPDLGFCDVDSQRAGDPLDANSWLRYREPRLSLMHPTAIGQGADQHEYVRASTICFATGQCDSLILTVAFIQGTWCSGFTSALHAAGPRLNPQCVHVLRGCEEVFCYGGGSQWWSSG